MEGQVIDMARDAMTTVIIVAAPMLLIALVVGLVISIFQATTQIQEQTLTFVPKIISILLSIIIFGSWMLKTLVEFTQRLYGGILQFIGI